ILAAKVLLVQGATTPCVLRHVSKPFIARRLSASEPFEFGIAVHCAPSTFTPPTLTLLVFISPLAPRLTILFAVAFASTSAVPIQLCHIPAPLLNCKPL